MRKLIVQEYVSADGFAAATDGNLDFFGSVRDYSEIDRDARRLLEGVDTILLGAATYRMFVEYWPTAEDQPVAPDINGIPKVVVSSTLQSAPWGEWPEATVLSGDAVELVADLKAREGENIILWGSLTLARSLLSAGLVDEVQLLVCPVALGEGQGLFPADTGELELIDCHANATGLVALRYRPRPA